MRRKAFIFLDIDAPVSMVKQYEHWLKHHWEFMAEKLGVKVIGYNIEESTNGNAHVVLYLENPITEDEELHYSLAFGGSASLYLISHMRLDAFGSARKVRFMKGKKRRPRANKAG